MALIALRRRTLVGGLAVLGCGVLLWSMWPGAAFVPSVRVPEGMSVGEALQAGKSELPKGWTTNTVPRGRLGLQGGFLTCAQVLVAQARAGMYELAGRTLDRAPGSPTVDHLLPRLSECSVVSGEKYLLAKEFVRQAGNRAPTIADSVFLGFVWGGTNQLRHARDRITLIEDGILKHGVFEFRLNVSPGTMGSVADYFPTNRCVIIRDTKGLVKIVPVEHLKAYVNSGLVRLPPLHNAKGS